jgi:hypothetical protein
MVVMVNSFYIKSLNADFKYAPIGSLPIQPAWLTRTLGVRCGGTLGECLPAYPLGAGLGDLCFANIIMFCSSALGPCCVSGQIYEKMISTTASEVLLASSLILFPDNFCSLTLSSVWCAAQVVFLWLVSNGFSAKSKRYCLAKSDSFRILKLLQVNKNLFLESF